jgi:hypothetical protein
MNKDKILKNAELAGADLSAFHEPDNKWRNYYMEEESTNTLYLVPSYLFYGVIVLDLDIARNLTFKTGDGVIHRLRDYAWGMSSNNRKNSYPKTAVIDRSIKCGRKTILLSSLIADRSIINTNSEYRLAVDNINGNKLDNRLCNLRFGSVKENNDNRYEQKIPEIKYPFKVWF